MKEMLELDETLEELKACARDASKFSYCPYSAFAVGAALLSGSGKIYSGCNVENLPFVRSGTQFSKRSQEARN